MLTIVEHEHELLRAEPVRNTFGRYRTSGEIEAEGCCHGGRDKLGIGQGRQLRDPNPVDKSRQQVSCDLAAEACLADTSRTDQGDEAMGGAEVQDLVQLDVAADQLRNRLREVCRRAGWRGRRLSHPRSCLRIRICRDRADLAGELVASPGNRADQAAVGRECLTQRRDLGLQAVVFDDPIWPDAIHQRVLIDYSTGRLDERHQHIERAPAELHPPALGEKLAAMRQDPETAEVDCRRCFRHGIHDGRS